MHPPRRRFLHALAAAPLLPALAEGPKAPAPVASPAPTPSPTPRAVDGVARALAQVIEARHGSQLEAGELEVIVKGIGDALEGAERLRVPRLLPSDEPATIFHARPAPARP